MIHWPGAVVQKFSTRIQPAVQNQLKPFMRPEEIPTAADSYEACDSADEDLRRRRALQAGVKPEMHVLGEQAAAGTATGTGSRSVLASPETRALVSNLFRGAVNSATDAAREEAPRLAEDLGDKEYQKKRDKHRAAKFSGNTERIYY